MEKHYCNYMCEFASDTIEFRCSIYSCIFLESNEFDVSACNR